MKKTTRRYFLKASALSAASMVAGCAVNPVTGESQLMLLSENQEIAIDHQNNPHQFSSDYGLVQDPALNAYLDRTGRRIASFTHRPQLPYSFNCVNAVYVNAYAFPGGTIGVTRGILLAMTNEAELAALLGHELGHINARHTAQQMSKSTLVQALSSGLTALAGAQSQAYGQLASQVSTLGAGALLASYSRENEREADSLSMEYMVRAGYNPAGVLELMGMLTRMSQHQPSALEMMFATHPMSSERYGDAQSNLQNRYAHAQDLPFFGERYMDNTASLRAKKVAIIATQDAEKALAKKNISEAETLLKTALASSPNDYTALCLMTKLQLINNNDAQALSFGQRAIKSYPQEAQGYFFAGLANIRMKRYQAALSNFQQNLQLLPGNPNTNFYLGLSFEGLQKTQQAAQQYITYLQSVRQGDNAQHAYQQLSKWGYVTN
nr:M48 family metalloprotease [Desulfobulbaceae bacterium]